MAHPRYGIAAYLIFPIRALHMKTPPQTLTIHLFQAASWRSVTSIHLPLTYMIDLWLSLPPNCPSRIKPSSHVFVEEEEEEEEEEKNIDVKRKSGCQRQLSLFFYISQENKYLQHILLESIFISIFIFIPCHPIPPPKSQQNAKPNPTNPNIQVSIQAKKPAPIPKIMMMKNPPNLSQMEDGMHG